MDNKGIGERNEVVRNNGAEDVSKKQLEKFLENTYGKTAYDSDTTNLRSYLIRFIEKCQLSVLLHFK